MATGGLYGNASESVGLYGNTTTFGGTYFEWFIFIQSDTQPATPTGGSWSFTTNSGTPPTGWSVVPPSAPTLPIWVSIALVNSKNSATLTWSAPGLFAYSSGLPILSGSGEPNPGDGLTSQLYIQTSTTPETIWFKQAGTWTRLTGSTLYADLTSNQTIAGTKTFSSQIQGSISGTASNVTGIVGITNGGTGSTTAAGARTALGVTATGQDTTYAYRANNLSDLASASSARTNLGLGTSAVLDAGVANGVATLDSGGTVPLSQIPASIQGGVSYQGTWNASTNTPTLTSSVGTKGYYYVVSVAGSTNLNGITNWNIGDWAIYNGTAWEKIDNTDAVTSVNGYTGTVVLNAADVGALSNVTSTDGSVTITSPTSTTRDLSVATAASTTNVLCQVRNTTGSTLTKGTVVYISGATGQLPTVSKAIATGDSTSAQTLGMMTADLANNSNGYVTVIGLITNIDTSAYTDGAQLYLSGTTAGAVTATKPSAPIHLVYIAVVEYAHPTQGKLFVKVQNGYELDEIHDVSIVSPVTGQTLVYNATTDLWVNNTVSLTAGVNGTLPIANGGTGQTTANAAFNALAPSQTGNSGKYLTTDGSNTSWATNPLGTVTSVGGTGTVSGITLSGTVTTSGDLTLGGTLNLSSPPAIGNTTPSTGNFTTLTENSVAVVTQSDIGSAPNEIPLNQYLGSLAYQNGDAYYNTGMTVGFRNRIINGAMMIDQRNAGASVTITDTLNYTYTLDRWGAYTYPTGSKFSVQQSTTAPYGFTASLKVTSLSAYSIGSSDIHVLRQGIEGFNVFDLAWGTSNAKPITLSFWVYSSVTGVFGGSLTNVNFNRSYPFTYTINNANTWEQKTIIVSGDTTGTWNTNNTAGLNLNFSFGVGSSYSGSANVWAGADYRNATGTTSLLATNGATLYITGVQLEKGNIATSFDVRSIGTELALCQRYFHRISSGTTGTGGIVGVGAQTALTQGYIYASISPTMRTTPTITFSSLVVSDSTTFDSTASVGTITGTQDSIYLDVTFSSSGALYRPINLRATSNSSGRLDMSSEL